MTTKLEVNPNWQEVYLARTVSGTPGYFTGRCLAFSLSEEDFARDDDWHHNRCAKLHFKFVPGRDKRNEELNP